MRLRTLIVAAGTTAVMLTTVWSASAGAASVTLGTDALSYAPPRIVVDSTGVGYTSWANGSSGQALQTCRLAPHASRCQAPHTFAFPGVGTSVDNGNSPVFTASGQLAVLDSRCCVLSNQRVLLLSSDHGTTFSGPNPIVSDAAGAMTGNLLDFAAGSFGVGSPEELLTSDTGAVTGGGTIQATGLAAASTDPGWYALPGSVNTLSESLGHSGSTLVAVFTTETAPHYLTKWVRYQGGDPNLAASWSAPQPLSPLPSLDSNAQLASGPAGIFVARSIATPGDNERLVVQRFTGSGWSGPVAITSLAAGERFAITESRTGRVYVIWTDTSGVLRYAVAKNKSASRFGTSVKVATRGEIEFPQIAVNGEGAGWVTWTNDSTPSHTYAVPIVPRPKVTRVGAVSLRTPRECVAVGGHFPVSLAVSGKLRLSGVRFSVDGRAATGVAPSALSASLTLRSATKPVVVVHLRLATADGHSRAESIRAPLIACY